MPKESAGLLIYRRHQGELEFLLVHPGGPFWKNKDQGAWTIPKGELEPGEDPLAAARREFEEETGVAVQGPFVALTPVVQKSGKRVYAWAVAANLDLAAFKSSTFTLEWPPRSGQFAEFPEVDRAAFFDRRAAAEKINPAQKALLRELEQRVEGDAA